MYECMNIIKGKAGYKKNCVLLESGCSYTVVMGGVVEKLCPEKDAPMQWNTQAENITANLKININFKLPALSATNVVTWKCHMFDSSKSR